MRVLIQGDIGAPGQFHAGDEQMALAAVSEITRRLACEIVAVSGDPEGTSDRYGWRSVPRAGFAADRSDAERDARLLALLDAARGDIHAMAWQRPEWTLIHAVAEADAVLVTGGGNLSSSWPEHVYERAAVAELALALERPLVVSGQSVGPHLTARHGELVGRVTTSAALVGVRDHASFELCRALGVPPGRLVHTVDDASSVQPPESAAWRSPTPQYVAASFSSHPGLLSRDEYVGRLARLVDHAAERTGLPVLLVPHAGATDDRRQGDVALHDEICAKVRSRVQSLAMDPGTEPAAARGAQLVLSTLVHPVVYALAGGVPSLAIATDSSTSMQTRGAMENMGMGAFALGVPALLSDAALLAVDELWTRRDGLRSHLLALSGEQQARSTAWWDAVAQVLRGGTAVALPPSAPEAQVEAGVWSRSLRPADDWAVEVDDLLIGTRLAAEEHAETRAAMQRTQDELGLRIAELQAELDDAAEETELLRSSARATQELAEGYLADLALSAAAAPHVDDLLAEVAALRQELMAMRRTRSFRYLAPGRAVWARIRPGRARG